LVQLYERILYAWNIDAKAKFNIDLDLLHPQLNSNDPSAEFFELTQGALKKLSKCIREPRLGIFLDEIELIIPPKEATEYALNRYLSLMRTLRGLVQEDGRVALMVAGVDPSINRINRWRHEQNPFYQLLQEVYLPPLSLTDCIQMIRNIGRQVGLVYPDESVEIIAKASGGHPFLARQLCSLVYRERNRQPGIVPVDSVRKAVERFIFDPEYNVLLNEKGLWGELCDERLWGEEISIANREVLSALAQSPVAPNTKCFSNSITHHSAIFALQQIHAIQAVKNFHNPRNACYEIKFGLFRSWLRQIQLGMKE